MTQTPDAGERFDLDAADDPRDLAHRVVAALAGFGAVAAPCDWGATVFAGLGSEAALAAVARHDGTAAIVVRSADALADWVPDLAPKMRRLIGRAWPGPAGFSFEADAIAPRGLLGRLSAEFRRRAVDPQGRVLFLSPKHPFLRHVLEFAPTPLLAIRADGPAAPSSGCRIVIESRSNERRDEPTVVSVSGEAWTVVRAGAVPPEELTRMDGTMILFVCTGNTCRSPMAEALCKLLLARRLKCAIDELERKGYAVASAGVYASNGSPAAGHAVEVVRSKGGALQQHRSRRLTPEMVARADLLVVMTGEHLDALIEAVPEAEPRARLLHPDGLDVDDPYGADLDDYRRTAEEIEAHLLRLLDEMGVGREG